MNLQEEENIKIEAYRVFESSNPRPERQDEIIKWERERMVFVESYTRDALMKKKNSPHSSL
jgi:hypothetical protein